MLLVGVSPLDPIASDWAPSVCVPRLSVAACYVPVYRAMRIPASDALRSE
jgi:hypothetical protein